MLFLTILGTILKIIGIALLCILLLLLFILLIVLFVPVRYRARLQRNGKEISAQAQVSYLFRLIRLPVSFEEGKLRIKLTVFGIKLYSNEGEARRRKKKKADAQEEEPAEDVEGTKESTAERVGEGIEGNKESTVEKAGEDVEGIKESTAEKQSERVEDREESTLEKTSESPDGKGQMEKLPERQNPTEQSPAEGKEENSAQELPDTQASQGGDEAQEIPGGILKPIWKLLSFLKRLLERIKAFFAKIAGIIQSVKEKIFSVKMKISDIKGMARLVLEFLRDEENKNGIKYTIKSIFRLLKHVLPYKIEGDIVFSTGDPYSMGRALSVLGMLYPLYARKLALSADFSSDCFRLDGYVQLKGRIRFASVLWIAWKMWSKGKLKRLLSKVKELKQKLTASAL